MSENEKLEQIGRLAEEYSHLKGQLNHVVEKLNHAQACYQVLSNPGTFQGLRAQNGKLIIPQQYGVPPKDMGGLLNHSQLVEVLEEKERLSKEIQAVTERLRAVAPHLV